MLKHLVVALLLVGALAKPQDNRNDEDMMKLNIVFCACDEDGNGSLSHDELTTEVCSLIVQHEVGEEDFAEVDADSDGEITKEEVIDWFSQHETKRDLARELHFSNDVHVEAMVRVLGCGCDNNGNYALDFEEFNTDVCIDLQDFMFGGHLDQEEFDDIDADNNGEVDGHEAASAIEQYHSHHGDDDGSQESDEQPDVKDIIYVVFCACDEDQSGTLSHEELTTDVCKVILDHELSAEDFASADADGDGEVSMEEVFNWVMSHGHDHIESRAISMKSSRGFSNDVHVDAMVRVLGCVCDNNGNYALDFDEFNSEVCVDVQNWMFGGTLDEEGFEAADQDSNGEIDGHEAADAIEYYFDNMHSK